MGLQRTNASDKNKVLGRPFVMDMTPGHATHQAPARPHFGVKKVVYKGVKMGEKNRFFQNISKLMGLQRTIASDKNDVLGRP